MGSIRIAAPEIESWTPAIDPVSVEGGQLFVLDGSRNYVFDAKGIKSFYGSRILESGIIDASGHSVQSLNVGGRTLICCDSGVYERRWTLVAEDTDDLAVQYYFKLMALDPDPEWHIGLYKWTRAFVGYTSYICHPFHGIFKVRGDSLEKYNPPGLNENPLAICEANGRLVILSQFWTQWSNAFNGDDLTPEIGGAGAQVTAELVPGAPLIVTGFQGGFIVWTQEGVLLFEYVGGEVVFRPDRVVTQQFLLNMNSQVEISTGENIVLTQQGLYTSSVTDGMRPMTPKFNEFLREMMKNSSDYSIRLDYNLSYDQLYVQVMDSTSVYVKTFVLSIALDKWGQFNTIHRGMIELDSEPGQFGYVDLDGYIHQFEDSSGVETLDGSLTGVDSEVIIGYIKPSASLPTGDQNFEIQKVTLHARETLTDNYPVTEEDWNGDDSFTSWNIGFYLFDQDFNNYGVDYYDENYNIMAGDEDLNAESGDFDENDSVAIEPDEDYNLLLGDFDYGATPDGGISTDYIEDWGYFIDPPLVEEDWDGFSAFYQLTHYGFSINFNIDGWEPDVTIEPSLAIMNTSADIWTCFTHGHNQRLILTANQPDEKFHLKFSEITVFSSGQQV